MILFLLRRAAFDETTLWFGHGSLLVITVLAAILFGRLIDGSERYASSISGIASPTRVIAASVVRSPNLSQFVVVTTLSFSNFSYTLSHSWWKLEEVLREDLPR